MTETHTFTTMQDIVDRCTRRGINPNRLHAALTAVAERALTTPNPGSYTAEGIAVECMQQVLDALGSRTIRMDGNNRLEASLEYPKIHAIKALREVFQMSLLEAKTAVEDVLDGHVISIDQRTHAGVDEAELQCAVEVLRVQCGIDAALH